MRKAALILAITLAASGCEGMNQFLNAGSDSGGREAGAPLDLSAAVKQALELSSNRASAELSQPGGYANDPQRRLGLPAQFDTITSTLSKFGLDSYVTQVEALMNRGAELAAAEAKDVFLTSIRQMTVTDAMGIIRGDDTAATDYFRRTSEPTLRERYQPIIRGQLEKVGFYDQYKTLLNTYNALPLASKPNLDLEDYVMDQSLNGLFTKMAEEESLLRADPLSRGSALLGSVFGSNH